MGVFMNMQEYGNCVRSLIMILVKATNDVFAESRVVLEHSIGDGIFGEIYKKTPLTKEDIVLIKNRMEEIIKSDYRFIKKKMKKSEAENFFKGKALEDKTKLLKYVKKEEVSLYSLEGYFDYFFGDMIKSTGEIKNFDIIYYNPGFILLPPRGINTKELGIFKEQKNLFKIFYESERLGNILGVGNVGDLNEKIDSGEITDIIRINEALHEKKIAYIADSIHQDKNIKVVLIAGPSSSGKTTFCNRLSIQLRVNGIIPVPISLDNYFVHRDKTPLDENGDLDFESIYALDLQLFNDDLNKLLEGKKVNLPIFDFKTGMRKIESKSIKLPENGVLLIEGIHGLNDLLTSSIDKKYKYKIYLSALTQLNLDNHNRISTSDVRIIRRIVRDSLSRGYDGESTLKMWNSIKRGEKKNIFIFQEEADATFNSTLVYELCVLKKYAIKELKKIPESSVVYNDAKRLIDLLDIFNEINSKNIPENSIIREFIGGSCFYEY